MGDKDTKMSAEEMIEEINKRVEACVGAECKKIREDFKGDITLDEKQLEKISKELHDKVGTEVRDDVQSHLQGINTRMSQHGSQIDENTKTMNDATSKIDKIIEKMSAPEPPASEAEEPPAPVIEECPQCGYGQLKEEPKIVKGCKNCFTGISDHEVDKQHYTNCPTCGDPLVPAQDAQAAMKKAKAKAEAKK